MFTQKGTEMSDSDSRSREVTNADVNVSQQDADIFADYPEYTPGQIGWGTLLRIVEWQDRNGIGDVSADTVRAYRDEGYGAAQAGVMLGLLDYGQATGCEDY